MKTHFLVAAALLLALQSAVLQARDPAVRGQPAEPAQYGAAAPARDLADFRSRLQATTSRHLDLLLDPKGMVTELKGKSTDGETALAYYQMFELTGNRKYRTAALALADGIVADMRATSHGVLFIKEKKEKGSGEREIPGGGPPAFAWYTAAAAHIFHEEGGRNDDLRYIATAIDNFPWNDSGWWANTIDIRSGQPKEPLSKPGAVNKTAAMAMSAGVVGAYVKAIDPALSARLQAKASKAIYKQILPAQEDDGFWHYGLNGKDPKNKDVLGYFMVTSHALVQLQSMTDAYRDRSFQAALDRAYSFAARTIAPMTDPNRGPAPPDDRATPATPAHYSLAEEPKRGFQLGSLLFAAGNQAEGIKIMDSALMHFSPGNAGSDGAHGIQACALTLSLLQPAGGNARR